MTRGSNEVSGAVGAILKRAKYYARVGGEYVETDRRPTATELSSIVSWLIDNRKYVHAHRPGDGWHFLPGSPAIMYNGSYWFGTYPTSEGAILAQVADICQTTGVSFDGIYRTAYGDQGEETPEITAAERAACERPATTQDIRAVLADLEDVNYHSLYATFEEAMREAGVLPQ